MALLSPEQQSLMIEEIKEECKNEIDHDTTCLPMAERFDPYLPLRRRRERHKNNMDILSLEDNPILSSSPMPNRQDPSLLNDFQKFENLVGNQDTGVLAPRNHPVYQSGLILSQSSSIVLQNQFYIFFSLNEIDGIFEEGTTNLVKIPLEELHESITVSEAIHSAIQLFNNMFHLQKINVKLIGDDKYYDLYLSKKDGRKKSSLPSLYPQEKMSKFPKTNLLLVSNDKKNIVRKYQRTNKNNNNLVIKEVNESMVSNTSFISAEYGNFNSPSQDNTKMQQKLSSSPEKKNKNIERNVKKPKIIQSTITTKQTKLDTEERDAGEAISTSTQSRCCFPFAFCWSQPKISSPQDNFIIPDASNVTSNQSHNNNTTNNSPSKSSRKPPAHSTSS